MLLIAQGAGVTCHAEALRPGDVTVAQSFDWEMVAAQPKHDDLEPVRGLLQYGVVAQTSNAHLARLANLIPTYR